jgi:hypothetical protein
MVQVDAVDCTCFFVDLNSCLVSIDPDDLSDKLIMSDTTLHVTHKNGDFRIGFWTRKLRRALTNSYMAHPIIFSATTTGPEMEKIEPY